MDVSRASRSGSSGVSPRREVERLLGRRLRLGPASAPAAPSSSDAGFPTHCIQTVQDLFSDVSQIGAVVVDWQGNPSPSQATCALFAACVQSTPEGLAACSAILASLLANAGGQSTSPATPGCSTSPPQSWIRANSWVISWPGSSTGSSPTHASRPPAWARWPQDCALPAAQLQAAAAAIQVIPAGEHARVEAWPFTAARAVQSILAERMAMCHALQQIATLTQM